MKIKTKAPVKKMAISIKKKQPTEQPMVKPRRVEFSVKFGAGDFVEYSGDLIVSYEHYKKSAPMFPCSRMKVTISRREGRALIPLQTFVLPTVVLEHMLPEMSMMLSELKGFDVKEEPLIKKKIVMRVRSKA